VSDISCAFFDTEIGRCGIAWSGRGVVALQLPESSEASTRSRLLRRCADARETAPPARVQSVIADIEALLRGERIDLSRVELDTEEVPEFHRRVYEVARAVQPGSLTTYGAIAKQLGVVGSAQAVGQALGMNPYPLIVPCHRVVAANGKLGGFSANGGTATKTRLLTIEKARMSDAPDLFDLSS
jgi:methylated-DNA-[protein]-cysteine S-methyltransferase